MNEQDEVLVNLPLVPDPDADQEMGGNGAETITDEEIKDCRLLLVRRAVTPLEINGAKGGAVAFHCTFQSTPKVRFSWARLKLMLTKPERLRIVDLQPREKAGEAVKITLNSEGKLGFEYARIEAKLGENQSAEYQMKTCKVHGSGENTPIARWDFSEDPIQEEGILREQTLALTLLVTGRIEAQLTFSARLARKGLRGGLESFRDLVLGTPNFDRQHKFAFDIPTTRPTRPTYFFNIT